MNTRQLLGSLTLACGCAAATAANTPTEVPPLFGDWWYIMPEGWHDATAPRFGDPCRNIPWFPYDRPGMYVPVNQPGAGHGGPTYSEGAWMSWYAMCIANQFDRLGAPMGLLIRNRNCLFPYAVTDGNISPGVLPTALMNLPKLDYLLMDLEPWGENGTEMMRLNADAIVALVRQHPNLRASDAFIGNYGDWPGERDEANIWPHKRDRTQFRTGQGDPWDRNQFYHDHFNIAMPIAYPYEVYSRHSDPRVQGENVTPNDRAAIFWAPIERVSVAARHLPRGHRLMPWITPYSAYDGDSEHYHAPPPTWDDLDAMVQHFRLRGANSYYVWSTTKNETEHPDFDHQTFRDFSMDTWRSLDPLFDSVERVEVLNLDTNKTGGLEWSGGRAGNTVWILVSNMHDELEQAAELPLIGDLPRETPLVAPGEHLLLTYQVNAAVRDFDNDGDIDPGDYVAFITSVQNHTPPAWANTVGGNGADPRDVDCNGLVDLLDVLAVSYAYQGGLYDPAGENENGSGGKTPSGRGALSNQPPRR
ncbi:MAG TPA: hypothetical protein ENK11_09170 [Phycisphaerales bacterium]|nr:hypothetical protein [Phycisphaerales bacterium]